MLKIGRYGIAFGRTFWVQTRVPATIRHFLCFWFFKEARHQDVDKDRKYPIGPLMEQESRVYRYYKASEAKREGDVESYYGDKIQDNLS